MEANRHGQWSGFSLVKDGEKGGLAGLLGVGVGIVRWFVDGDVEVGCGVVWPGGGWNGGRWGEVS